MLTSFYKKFKDSSPRRFSLLSLLRFSSSICSPDQYLRPLVRFLVCAHFATKFHLHSPLYELFHTPCDCRCTPSRKISSAISSELLSRNRLGHTLLVDAMHTLHSLNQEDSLELCNIPDIKSMQNRNKMIEMAE
jgi:hypothetical protein